MAGAESSTDQRMFKGGGGGGGGCSALDYKLVPLAAFYFSIIIYFIFNFYMYVSLSKDYMRFFNSTLSS